MRELYQVWSSSLSPEQVDKVTSAALSQQAQEATIFSPTETTRDIRRCTVRWLPDPWVKALLWPYIRQANENGFNIDVDNRAEMQFTEYCAEQGGHYGWHHDVQWNGQAASDRKLSITVQLSAPDEYEGGDFEFDEVHTNADFKSRGTVLVFPSYLRHRIRPVISGNRRALIAWFYGPRWR